MPKPTADKPKDSSLRCYWDMSHIPPEAYGMDGDGRKHKSLRKARRDLALQLAGYANPDGSNIKVSIDTLAFELDCVPCTVHNLLNDLVSLGCLVNESRLSEYRGTRVRHINPEWLASEKNIAATSKAYLRKVSLESKEGGLLCKPKK